VVEALLERGKRRAQNLGRKPEDPQFQEKKKLDWANLPLTFTIENGKESSRPETWRRPRRAP